MVIQGAHVLYAGEEPISADIIFVHGLRGDAYETWTVDKICWPRDFLKTEPKLKHTRVITWGYDSSVAKLSDFSSQSSIFSHAENLLIDLVRKRQESEEENRPIVFVGHSLGGLVIKEALIRSAQYLHNNQDADLGAIYRCTAGTMFMGTPHRGSDQTGLAKIVSNVAKVSLRQPNEKLLDNLKRESDVLENQRKGFVSISKELPVVCLYEDKPIFGIGLIVDQTSAVCDGFWVKSNSIPANHMDMCKFESKDNAGYGRTSMHIISLISQATKKKASTSLNLIPSPSKDSTKTEVEFERDIDGRTALHRAAFDGDIVKVRNLSQRMPSQVNAEDNCGMTPLHCAAQAGEEILALLLIKKGARLESEDDKGRTPLICGASYGHAKVVTALLSKGANVEAKDLEGRTCVRLAFNGISDWWQIERIKDYVLHKQGDHTTLERYTKFRATLAVFVANDIDIESATHYGEGALAFAAKTWQLEIVEHLVYSKLRSKFEVKCLERRGKDPMLGSLLGAREMLLEYKFKDSGTSITVDILCGGTVLHWAVWMGNIDLARLMLDLGADSRAKTKYGDTALYEASGLGDSNMVKLLVERDSSIIEDGPALELTSPLQYAAERGHTEILKILLDSGSRTEAEQPAGWGSKGSALYLASRGGHLECVRALLDHKAQVDAKSGIMERTALMAAVNKGYQSIARLLVERGANVRAKAKWGESVLHHAASSENPKTAIVQWLLENGAKADVTVEDSDGRTPVYAAARSYNKAIENMLRNAGGSAPPGVAQFKGWLEHGLFGWS